MTLNELRSEIDLQLSSIQQSAAVIKSDDVVDDDQCDAVVESAQKIAEAFNKYLKVAGAAPISVPEALEPSEYQ